ncbi:MAG: hypothetical protein ACOY82_07540 [Pseudomonadota bacterium]
MPRLPAHALTLARPAIQVATWLNLLYGAGLVALFVAGFVIPDWPMKPLGYDRATMDPNLPLGLRAAELLGLAMVALVHRMLRRLLAIVDSVRDGDPFVVENAVRLQSIAWSLLGVESLRLAMAGIAAAVGIERVGAGGFALAPWLAILLLFVLAGVFMRGARMRADLEGTV